MSPLPAPADLLSELVAIPSPSGEESASAGHILDLAHAAGLEAERVGDSVLALVDRGGPRVLFNTHHDTVPVGEGWDADPFDGVWHGEGAERRLVARGANDAKASVAAMLTAAQSFAEQPGAAGSLLLAITACEETSNAGMTAVLERLAERGLEAHAGVTGEPTELEVVRAQSGLCLLEATWRGVACHAAHVSRVEHENALTLAVAELAALPPYFVLEGQHPLLGTSTLTPTVLTSGERHNLVPDLATCVFDGRIAPPHTAQDCAALLADRLPRARVRVRSDRLRPVETPADHPLVKAALIATGRKRTLGSPTMSDMALLHDIPTVKCGPGATARSHTANEHLLERELLAACDAYRALIPLSLDALS